MMKNHVVVFAWMLFAFSSTAFAESHSIGTITRSDGGHTTQLTLVTDEDDRIRYLSIKEGPYKPMTVRLSDLTNKEKVLYSERGFNVLTLGGHGLSSTNGGALYLKYLRDALALFERTRKLNFSIGKKNGEWTLLKNGQPFSRMILSIQERGIKNITVR